MDLSVPLMHHYLNDLESLILIQFTAKEHTLNLNSYHLSAGF